MRSTRSDPLSMDIRRIGESDLLVSAICLGTMTFGQQNSEPEGHAQLDYAQAHGVNFIDTAEMYPVPARAETSGRSEKIVGSWLRKQPRDRVVIATKVAGPSRGMPWIRGGPLLNRAQILAAAEQSLLRLQTDYIDLYQLHWPERNTPMFGDYRFDPAQEHPTTSIHAQLEALVELVRSGKVRYIGLSNEHPWGTMEFLRLARLHDLPVVVSMQNSYSLLNRMIDFSMAEVLFRERIGLLAYSPLAFGYLTGKYLDDPGAPGRIAQFPAFGQRYNKPNMTPSVAAYVQVARKHQLRPTQMALAWLYRHWGVTSTIIGATTQDQLQENLQAWDITLSDACRADIEAVHVRYPNPAP